MSQSFVQKVIQQDRRYVGQTPVYTGSVNELTSEPFVFNIDIASQIPVPELEIIALDVQGVPATDTDGTVYSGQFHVGRNINGTPSITVSGSTLTQSQIQTIENSLSLTETVASTGVGSLTTIQMSLAPIAASGSQFFDIGILYEDTSVSIPPVSVVIPFMSFDASDINTASFPNPITVNVNTNDKMTIDAGSVVTQTDLIRISRASSSLSRDITYINLNKSGNSPYIQVSWLENASNEPAILISAKGEDSAQIYQLPEQADGANYYVKIQSLIYKVCSAPPIFAGGSPPTYTCPGILGSGKVGLKVDYGIGKPENGSIVAVRYMNATFYAGSSLSFTSSSYTLRFQFNDSGASVKNAFGFRHTFISSFTALSLNSTTFVLSGYRNTGSPYTFTYSFSSSIRLEEMINGLKDALLLEVPEWYSAITFTIADNFKLAKCQDLVTVSYDTTNTPGGIVANTTKLFVVRPTPINTSTLFSYDVSTKTMWEVYNWIADTFGSYGLILEWDRGDSQEWKDLPAVPILFKSTGSSSIPAGNIISGGGLGTLEIKGHVSFFSPSTSSPIPDDGVAHVIPISVSTVGSLATYIADFIDVPDFFPQFDNIPNISVDITVPVQYTSMNVVYLKYHINSSTFETIPSGIGSFGDTLNNTQSNIPFGTSASVSGSFQIDLTFGGSGDNDGTLLDLVNEQINEEHGDLLFAELLDPTYADVYRNRISNFSQTNIATNYIVLSGATNIPLKRDYLFSQHITLTSLIDLINQDWQAANLVATLDPSTEFHADAIPSNLRTDSQVITSGVQPHVFSGNIQTIPASSIPNTTVTLNFNLAFASDNGGFSQSGIQVALGGYEREGVFYSNNAPNSFLEPVYNYIFPIEYSVSNADVIYILVRTRTDLLGEDFVSDPSRYTGLVTYSDGTPSYTVSPFVPTIAKFTDVWDEGGSLGVPTVIAIPAYSKTIHVSLEDTSSLDSINLKITNSSSEIDTFGFLAINRTNSNASQTESRTGSAYGLVLDNRGAWDIIISPEATLQQDNEGSISYLGSNYTRTILSEDEGYDFEIITELPTEIQNSITISPLPSNPQVWVLRIDYGVKRYLAALRRLNTDPTSTDGCSVIVELKATGRSTGLEGTAFVSIYYDYTCVYDIGLCDFFWNLIDYPKPKSPEIVQNRLDITYESLVDCNNLTTPIQNNIAVNVPMLITVNNIPTFSNGEALLLIKSMYTAEIQGFYFPTGNQLDTMQYSNCSALNLNIPLMRRLNKEFLLLPNQEDPIEDISQIRDLLITSDSYLWAKPQFYFPPTDDIKDCGPNEIVLVGMGYKFKNWTNGTRQDNVIVGLNLVFPEGVYSSPEMEICYRYYYNQYKT